MKYGSVCSGIEAATVAWHPLGWAPAFFSEVDKFPSAVLAERYLDVPNLGDMTNFEEWPDYAIDLLVGGTPCQDYSIAGQRLGMAGSRGQLTLTYVEIAARYRPRWVVWENVPGVLSSNEGRDFARFLGDLSGQRIEVPEGGWKNSGIISGIEDAYGLAYCVRDAQYVRTQPFPRAVPQRRRRVFVIGYLGDWRRAAAVLFDAESLRGDSPPRREAGQSVAGTLNARTQGGGGLGTDFELAGGLQAFGGGNTAGPLKVSTALTAHGGRLDFDSETFVAHSLRGEGFDASEDGTGRGTPIVPVAFDCKGTEVQYAEDGSHPTLRSMGHSNSHQNGGGHAAIAIQERAVSENPDAGPDGVGVRSDGAAYTLEARTVPQSVVDGAGSWAARRLTPRECERLQGFPDGFTAIPWRGKSADQCPDGPRYKALGNSMAVNVMQWVGGRIAMAEQWGAE